MAEKHSQGNWKGYFFVTMALLIFVTVIAGLTGLWVLTAVPVGFLFGFFLQKGALCGSSAFSEVLLMKDTQKLWGLWIVIVTGMGGFALLDLLGLVTLNPKPFTWLSMIAGGAVFGVGMVLAGGCVSGSLFKAGTGHINSIAALLSIALGVAAVEAGPLQGLNSRLKAYVVTAADGGPVTLSSLTGLSFQLLALIVVLVTVIWSLRLKKRRQGAGNEETGEKCGLADILTKKRWKPWQAGLAIGLLGSLAYLSSAASGRNYPLGVTHGVYHVQVLLTDSPVQHVYRPPAKKPAAEPPVSVPETSVNRMPQDGGGRAARACVPGQRPGTKKVNWWLVAGVISLTAGAWAAARLSGEAKLYNKSADQILIAIAGGFLVGAGAGLAKGCVVGNIMSGWALMSMGTVLFGLAALVFNWLTTYTYLMGGRLSDLRRKS